MTGRRSSARQAAKASSQPSSSQSNVSPNTGTKRKASPGAQSKSKRGRKGNQKEQSTIESSMPSKQEEGSSDDARKDEIEPQDAEMKSEKQEQQVNGDEEGAETARKVEEKSKADSQGSGEPKHDSEKPKQNGLDKIMETKEDQPNETPDGSGSKVAPEDDAVEDSKQRNNSVPSSVLEKGIIYFFFRGRVGIDEPDSVNDVARSYIVLRPLPQGAKLGEGPIGDAGTNRMIALPKKVLPVSPKDRFLSFVEKANCSMDEIKEQLSSSDYSTKTAGVRHTPAAAPIGEGVYAITQTGRDTHLAYILTIPAELDEVQKGIGLRQRGSYFTSAKNPQSSAPANAQLPQGAEYPQAILDEFGSRGWMPLQPKLLNYDNTQFLLIGHKEDALEKAAQPQDKEDQKDDKETPLEEIEKLEGEDDNRVSGLADTNAIFTDLGLSSKGYPKVQTTW